MESNIGSVLRRNAYHYWYQTGASCAAGSGRYISDSPLRSDNTHDNAIKTKANQGTEIRLPQAASAERRS
jgi:hypothetical protein